MTRPTAAERGYTAKWQRFRRRILRQRPVCEQAGCGEASVEVHHLDGLGPLGPRGYDETNLQALCKPHHSQITAREQPGGWARREPRRRQAERHPGLL